MTKKNDLIKKVVDGIFARHNKDVDAPLNKKSEAKIELDIEIESLGHQEQNAFMVHGISDEGVSAKKLRDDAIEAVMARWEEKYGEKAAIAPAKKVAPPPPRPDVKPVASSRAAPPVPAREKAARKPAPTPEEFVAKMVGYIFDVTDGNKAMGSSSYKALDKESAVSGVMEDVLFHKADDKYVLTHGLKSGSETVAGDVLKSRIIKMAMTRWSLEHPAAITHAAKGAAAAASAKQAPAAPGSKPNPDNSKPRSNSNDSGKFSI